MTPETPDSRGPVVSAAEVALTALTMAAAVGLVRVFADTSFLPRVLVAATGVHLLGIVLRRRGVGMGPTTLVLLGAGGLVAIWTTVPEHTTLGIPTPDTLTAIREAMSEGLTVFRNDAAPVSPVAGLVMMAVVGTWVLGALADWAAFRVQARFEATVPSFTLFVFGATLGAEQQRLMSSVVWVTALVAFLATHHSSTAAAGVPWLGQRSLPGQLALGRRAMAVAALTLAAAAVVGPNLPGADAEAIVPWRDDRGDEADRAPRVTVSPLVDIRRRLVSLPNVEAFTVAADVRSYWRLTALDTFDGRIWSGVSSYSKADGGLPTDIPESLPTIPSTQEFQIGALETIWLPAAFHPTRVLEGDGLRYDEETGSFVTEEPVADGQRYVVESAVPDLAPDLLASAPVDLPPDGPYLALPESFSPRARSLAASLVDGARTPYEAALALQGFFRSGSFEYSLEVPPGHDTNALDAFLFTTRAGYCEQFAGAYAALARAVGLPSRVAVGFTPGELGDDGRYHVRGEHAHAWPEVWLAGAGWVAFEPTPGRGAPGAEDYTGVPEQQAATGQPNDSITATTVAPTTPPTEPPTDSSVATVAPTSQPEAGGSGTDRQGLDWVPALLVAVLGVVGAAILVAGTGAGINAARRARRRTAAARAADRVDVAWQEAVEGLVRAGVPPVRGATPEQVARDARTAAGTAAEDLSDLARLTTVVAYGTSEPEPRVAERANEASNAVTGTLLRNQPPLRRLRWIIDPRSPRRP